jgi:hypothetical protein
MRPCEAAVRDGIVLFSRRADRDPRGQVRWVRLRLRDGAGDGARNLVVFELSRTLASHGVTVEGGPAAGWSLQLLISADQPGADVPVDVPSTATAWLEAHADVAHFEVEPPTDPAAAQAILDREWDRVQRELATTGAAGEPANRSAAGSATDGRRPWWKFWKSR